MILKKWILTAVFVFSVSNVSALSQLLPPASPQENRIFVPVTVVAQSSTLVTALPQESFSISVNKAPQQILGFSKPDQVASIAVLLDVSGSVFERLSDKFSILKEALVYFIQCSHPSNEYSFYTFGRQVNLEMDWSQDRTQLLSRINSIEVKKSIGKSILFDACVEALQSLKQRNNQRRVLFIMSDGEDNESIHHLKEVKQLSYATQTTIYVLNIGTLKLNSMMMNSGTGGTLTLQAQEISEELAKQSGGASFIPRGKHELFDSIQRAAKYIRCTYLLRINPLDLKKESKPNKLQINVAVPPNAPKEIKDVNVLYPQFYIAQSK